MWLANLICSFKYGVRSESDDESRVDIASRSEAMRCSRSFGIMDSERNQLRELCNFQHPFVSVGSTRPASCSIRSAAWIACGVSRKRRANSVACTNAVGADPPFAKLGRGKLNIRSISKKQRPRR